MRNLDNLELKLFTNLLKEDASSLKKYLLDRALRKITENNQLWPVTELVEESLKKHNLWCGHFISKSKVASTLNRKLKKLESEGIYFEHWKPISEMIAELLNLNLSEDIEIATVQVEKYLLKNTDCFFRLKKSENHLQPHLQKKHWKTLQSQK